MLNEISLTSTSLDLLQRRNINQDEINEFQQLLNLAQDKLTNSGQSAKQILQNMNADDLALLQKANALADAISVKGLSEEGATNLLKQPDHSDRVDLNNDGIVEVGIGKSMVFPPVNAPDFVKQAWSEATLGMDEKDTMMLQLHMHIAVFGIQIEGFPGKAPLPPAQQWAPDNIQGLLSELRGALEFAVNMDGWTDIHKMQKAFYERFEQALTNNAPAFAAYATAPQNQEAAINENENTLASNAEAQTQLDTLMQLILDARMGLDRRKLEEIEEKIKAIENSTTLDPAAKKALLTQLENQKQDILDKAQERIEQQEKMQALQHQLSQLL